MAYSKPTLQEIINRIKNDFLNRITGASTLLKRSVLDVMSKGYGGACHLQYDNIEDNKNQLFATTADTSFLELIGAEIGTTRNSGVKAVGTGTGSGIDGITVPAGTILQSATGNNYVINSDATIASGIITLAFSAEEVGSAYNEDAGIELSFVSPIAGVNTTVTVGSAGIINGVDEETDDDYRERVLDRKRQPPHGGADFDYEKWAKELSGVTRTWAVPLYYGIGTVGLAFVRDNDDDLIPNETERLDVYNYIVSHTDPGTGKIVGIPITAKPGFFVIPIEKKTINFSMGIYPNTEAVQSSIRSRLEDLMLVDSGPGLAIVISRMYEAIASATGEAKSRLIYPTDDVSAATNQVQVLGSINFEDY